MQVSALDSLTLTFKASPLGSRQLPLHAPSLLGSVSITSVVLCLQVDAWCCNGPRHRSACGPAIPTRVSQVRLLPPLLHTWVMQSGIPACPTAPCHCHACALGTAWYPLYPCHSLFPGLCQSGGLAYHIRGCKIASSFNLDICNWPILAISIGPFAGTITTLHRGATGKGSSGECYSCQPCIGTTLLLTYMSLHGSWHACKSLLSASMCVYTGK